ncbi:MAG: S-methyl-5'-thioadenosine phosphorylase [Deltaproteobacteria bacterium]|nr:S-methyl-5'-thioadenosine phosphorylase [Deltaproteobacteria bacterium]MBW2445826.1 S-methyl-5'-thioadenosine phosphorylase [Deltaproteobacteria bacterium]
MAESRPAVVGVIGGSGLYELGALANAKAERVVSPFGEPSAELLRGEVGGVEFVFLPRHGPGHVLPPSDINYRANIDALKRAGVTDLISLSACGSLREDLPPGSFVLVDQFIDRTVGRARSFFGPGCVAHVVLADPVCARLGDALESEAGAEGLPVQRGGTYLAMEGPQFSTRAESELFRSWGCSVIGMTNLPEARLAREAELCYATVAMVTDYDCWREDHDAVSVEAIVRVLTENAAAANALVERVTPQLAEHPERCPHGCDRALEGALITQPASRDPECVARLDAVAGRVLDA